MSKNRSRLALFSCILITLLVISLKYAYQSLNYFNSIMLPTILLTIVLRNTYTWLFTTFSVIMVSVSIFANPSSEFLLAQVLLLGVVLLAAWGVFYIKKLYKNLEEERKQMNLLLIQRKEAQEELQRQKELLEQVTTDIKRLNSSLEKKVEERTLILRSALQEVERSEEELSNALNKEKELNDIKSRFLTVASHEFRTPLSTIFSSAALIGRYTQTEDQDKRNKHLWRIRDSVQHLNGLLDGFLNLAKLQDGKVKVEPTVFDAREFIMDVCEEMQVIEKPDQKVWFEYKGVDSFISDKRLLKNILINLLSNAIKFSDPGKKIHVNVSNEDAYLVIDVQDEGIGIPAEDLQHLFTSFFRGKNATNIEGAGLGLNIVDRYVQLLQGTIRVASEIDRGTTFQIRLPHIE